MQEKIKISIRQLMILAMFVTVGDSILVLPAIPTMIANRDAWISAILGLAIGLLFVILFVKASKINHKLTFVELSKTVLGKWVGLLVVLLFICYTLINLSIIIRGLGDFAVSQIMPDTPIEAIIILMLGLVVVAVRLGLETIARVAEMFFPLFILFFVLLVLSLLPSVDVRHALPVFDHGIRPIIHGSIACAAFPFMELIILMCVFPYVNTPEKIGRGVFTGALLGGIVLVIIIALSVLVLGAEGSARLLYPGFDMAKRVNIANFFQRIEAVLALLWIITVFFKLSLYLYAFSRAFSQLFNLKDFRMILLPISMFLVVLSLMIAPNITYFNKYLVNYWPYFDITLSVFIPAVLLIVYAFRKRALQNNNTS